MVVGIVERRKYRETGGVDHLVGRSLGRSVDIGEAAVPYQYVALP